MRLFCVFSTIAVVTPCHISLSFTDHARHVDLLLFAVKKAIYPETVAIDHVQILHSQTACCQALDYVIEDLNRQLPRKAFGAFYVDGQAMTCSKVMEC